MSSDKPAFAQSLVAMYGSSSESSEEEDSENTPSQDVKPTSESANDISENPEAVSSGSGEPMEVDCQTYNPAELSANMIDSQEESLKSFQGVSLSEVPESNSKPTEEESENLPQDIVKPVSDPIAKSKVEDEAEMAVEEEAGVKSEMDVEEELEEKSAMDVDEEVEDKSEVEVEEGVKKGDSKEETDNLCVEGRDSLDVEEEPEVRSVKAGSFEEESAQELSENVKEEIEIQQGEEKHSSSSVPQSLIEEEKQPKHSTEPDKSIHCNNDSVKDCSRDIEVQIEAQKECGESEPENTDSGMLEPVSGETDNIDASLKCDNTDFEGETGDEASTAQAEPAISSDPIIPDTVSSKKRTVKGKPVILDRKKKCPSPGKSLLRPPGRRLRQIRHPSAKAAEAAADAAFVAAVTPTRKNLKEAKIACAIANVTDSADVTLLTKKTSNSPSTTRGKKSRSSSLEQSMGNSDSRTSPLTFSEKEDSSSSEKSSPENLSDEMTSSTENIADEEKDLPQSKSVIVADAEKPVGIKLKISRESVQILDPIMSKLEVQIPSEATFSDVSPSPGSSKRSRKFKEGTPSPVPPMSPITLKIAKSKEGLEVISTDSNQTSSAEAEVGKVEKITLKLSREEGAMIVKSNVDESADNRLEKLTLKLTKDEGSSVLKSSLLHTQSDVEETKLEKITLKLSKGDSACIVKKRDTDFVSSSSDNDTGKLERITLKRSTDNNVSIVRPKDNASFLERSSSSSPEPGRIEKITLKVSKNDNISIVKPASPSPLSSSGSIEKLTLKVSKDGTAAVSAKQYDEPIRDNETAKLEKITLKLSKDEGVCIVKPASPVSDRKIFKSKDEPLSPLSPLIISRIEDAEPQKERITLKLSKAGGHPSPVGIVDDRSSWSIKSTDSDTVPSPVALDPATPKTKPKRAFSETQEAAPSLAKRLKLSEVDKLENSQSMTVGEVYEVDVKEDVKEEDMMDVGLPHDGESVPECLVKQEDVRASADSSIEVVVLDSEDSLSGPVASDAAAGEPSAVGVDVENEIQTTKIVRRKPRGRPRKAVLTPGAIPVGTLMSSGVDSVSTPKPKREKVRVEPTECDRPKRSCKGREKPPPKPAKPVKPRGRTAALAKQKAEQSLQPEGPQLFEEETRMSADGGCQSQTTVSSSILSESGNASNGLIAKVILPKLSNQYHSLPTTPVETPAASPGHVIINEESQGSVSMVSSTTESPQCRGNRKGRMEINVDPDAQAEFTVDMIAEYTWPLNDSHAETYMIQEQISAYLGVKSFKRKYPNMQRRTVDHDERQYLLERKLVSESLCDLGLTALPSYEVLDVLCTDFSEKYEEYCLFLREKVQRELSNKQKALLSGINTGKDDPKSKAMRNMASFNALLNRSRRELRRCCFDLQSFTVHYPEQRRQRMGVANLAPIGPYPIALVPGQYTDYFKEYTPTELRYFPLNTVLYGPLLPHEMMMSHTAGGSDGSQTDSSDSSSSDSSSSDSDSSGSDSDSDSDSSSDSNNDSSSHIGIAPVENHDSEVDRPDAVCRVCNGDKLKNKLGHAEPLVHCASCEKSGHLSCLDLTVDMFPHIRKYSWHCTDCKLCAQCNDTADEDKMLFCDMCDRGYHIYCVGLRKVPEGRWHCQECALCASCGARDPGGSEEHQATVTPTSPDTPTKLDISQWQHEFKKGDKGTRIYVRTLCVPCSKLWRKGRYCRLCWKCYSNQPEDEGLINCSICDRWMHADCCRKAGRVIDVDKVGSYICELCQQKGVRVQLTKIPSTKLYR